MSAQQPAPLSKPVIFGTSGLGGIMGWMVVHPFNTLAIRMNLSVMQMPAGSKIPSFGTFASDLVKKEGFMTLYSGIGAGIVRQLFYATSRYGLFEVFRDNLAAARGGTNDFLGRASTAVAAGACAAYISCPAEVSLVRMSNDNSLPEAQRRNYKGVADCALRIAREEGIGTFWRGSNPFVARAMLVGGTQVATYDQFKSIFGSFGLKGIPNVFCSAMSAGLIYSIITMPLETAKNRMAFQSPDPATGKLPYTGTIQTVKAIIAKDGLLACWNGFIPYYGRCGGHTVSMFIAVEWLRKQYRAMQ